MNPALQAAITAAMKDHGTAQTVEVSGGACLLWLLVLASVTASIVALVVFL